jgi:hypothetical protein
VDKSPTVQKQSYNYINMSPDQKRWNDRFISIITLALLALLALIVAAFLINEIRLSNSYPFFGSQTPVEKGRVLTTDEVSNERTMLPPRTPLLRVSESTLAAEADGVGQSVQIDEARLAEIMRQTSVLRDEIALPPSSFQLSNEYNVESGGVKVAQVAVYSSSDNSVLVGAVNVNQASAPVSVEGVVFSRADNHITITSPDYGSFNLLYNNSTRFAINGKPMAPSDLLVGDIVVAEGLGSLEGREMMANVVLLVGKIEIFMPI